jgi:hypothetical protein
MCGFGDARYLKVSMQRADVAILQVLVPGKGLVTKVHVRTLDGVVPATPGENT